MKASQLTTRNRTTLTITRILLTVTLLTFFAAAHADARCRDQVTIESRILEVQRRGLRDLGVHHNGRLTGIRPDVQEPTFDHNRNDTAVPINDPYKQKRKEEELRLRRQVIDGLKQAGVIREPGQTTTTTPRPADTTGSTTRPANDNSTGDQTTTAPKPKPKPKKPRVTRLPNGDRITDYPDGRREVKLKSGDTVTTYPNGKRVVRNADGDTTETHPSGYRKTTNRYGDGRAVFPDGTRIDFKSNGEATLTTPDGRTFHRKPGKGFVEVD